MQMTFPFAVWKLHVPQKNVVMTDNLAKVCIQLLLSSELAPTEGGGSQKHSCRKCNSGTFTANISTLLQ